MHTVQLYQVKFAIFNMQFWLKRSFLNFKMEKIILINLIVLLILILIFDMHFVMNEISLPNSQQLIKFEILFLYFY